MQAIHDVLMVLGFGLCFFFGLVFIDTSISWLAGQWTYADWRFQMPSVLLCLVVGVQYVVGSFLVKPKISDIVFVVISGIIMGILVHGYTLTNDLRHSMTVIVIGMLILIFCYLGIWALDKYLESKSESWRNKNKTLWDIRASFKKIFNRKVNVILWAVLIVEIYLKVLGSSLFIW